MNTKARFAALLASGVIAPITGEALCAECKGYPDVLDGHRKANRAKYVIGDTAACGIHALRIAEAREAVWNGKQYVARTADAAPKAKKPTKDVLKFIARACTPRTDYPGFKGTKVCEAHLCTNFGDGDRCTKVLDVEAKGGF